VEKRLNWNPRAKISLERYKKHNIDIVVDTVSVSDENLSRIFEDTEKALKLSDGLVKIKMQNTKLTEASIFNQKLACPIHDEISFPEMEPRIFSFNSPFGACPACEGLGTKEEIDIFFAYSRQKQNNCRRAE